MAEKCKNLTEMIENSDCSFEPDEEDFAPVFHELYENNDFKGMKKLLVVLAKSHFETKNYITYDHAFAKAREDLDSFTKEAETLFGNKGVIREFYREAVDYYKRNKDYLYNFSIN